MARSEKVVTWKPSLLWQDNIKAGLLERRLSYVGSLEISQDQVQWLGFVNHP